MPTAFETVIETLRVRILDLMPGSSIEALPGIVVDLTKVANRMCRIRIKGKSDPEGTGFLVGPDEVLTAGHLFFDDRRNLVRSPDELEVVFDTLALRSGTTISASQVLATFAATGCFIDPVVQTDGVTKVQAATREVTGRDYARLRLNRKVGEEKVRGSERGWFSLPPRERDAPVLVKRSMVYIVQYVDAGPLRVSVGQVESISPDRMRIEYRASTLDRASGSAILDSSLRLAAIHVSGPERPSQGNLGMPIARLVS